MIKEVMANAPTIDEAIEKAAQMLQVDKSLCSIEIIETPKRSLFGKTKDAVIKATLLVEESTEAPKKADIRSATNAKTEPIVKAQAKTSATNSAQNKEKLEKAKVYIRTVLDKMGLNAVELVVSESDDSATITLEGENLAVLIGHHGETLDALQYLASLTSNRSDGDYYRVTLDCGNYRVKREATLQGLAAKIADKVKKSGRSQILEPMNPYERRIIHAVVSEIPGVSSKSKGDEPNRRVVIVSDAAPRRTFPASGGYNNNTRPATPGGARPTGGTAPRRDNDRKPYVHKPERTMEEILRDDFKEKENKAELYSKIEL